MPGMWSFQGAQNGSKYERQPLSMPLKGEGTLCKGPFDKLLQFRDYNGTKVVTWRRTLSETLIEEHPVYIECIHFSEKPSTEDIERVAMSRYDENNPKVLAILPNSVCFYSANAPDLTNVEDEQNFMENGQEEKKPSEKDEEESEVFIEEDEDNIWN